MEARPPDFALGRVCSLARGLCAGRDGQAGGPSYEHTWSDECACAGCFEVVFASLGGDGDVTSAVAAVEMVGAGGAEAVFAVASAGDFGG
jgi:hypothetical protein